jgi:hypothetical protein
MDLQTLDRNFFWYERPRVIVQELKDYFDEVEDVTGLSDGAPSILVNKKYYVFLPTGIVDHNELEYNKYTVMREEDYGFGNEYHRFSFMDEVIEYLQQMLKEDETISKREILHRMRMIMDDLNVIKKQFNVHYAKFKVLQAGLLLVSVYYSYEFYIKHIDNPNSVFGIAVTILLCCLVDFSTIALVSLAFDKRMLNYTEQDNIETRNLLYMIFYNKNEPLKRPIL